MEKIILPLNINHMKTQKLISGLSFAILFCFNFSLVNARSLDFHIKSFNKVPAKLKYVFVNEVDSINKDILKLYDDFTYEFLFFQKNKNKPIVKREKGTYSLKKDKLILDKETKAELKEHSDHFVFIENKGLTKSEWFNRSKKETELLYVLNNDAKYWLPTYHDPYFGDITNDKKASKKIIEKKSEYVPVRVLADIGDNSKLTLNTNSAEDDIEPIKSSNGFISRDSLKQLKAIIIVGPVDKEWDKNSIAEQKKNAEYLRNLGVLVFEFYPPNDKWEAIVKASEGAHILIYSGHGSNQGINYNIGGLCLSKNIYHAQDIVNEFKLHKNALILFNGVCNGAGSSASDNGDIGKEEALKRVGEYAFPFIKLSAGAYYANNYNSSWVDFFNCFFERKTIKKIYTKEATKYQKIEVCREYQYNQKMEIAVASREGTGKIRIRYSSINSGAWKAERFKDFKTYDVAYVGKPNLTIVDLFKQ